LPAGLASGQDPQRGWGNQAASGVLEPAQGSEEGRKLAARLAEEVEAPKAAAIQISF
jgi:hypothetical protein